jgi:O-methyltransferase involved in polyketide biosynthesis
MALSRAIETNRKDGLFTDPLALLFLGPSLRFAGLLKAVASMTAERLDTVIGPPARNLTGHEWLWPYFTHTAYHRAQAEVYLRVKGIKPPDYKF